MARRDANKKDITGKSGLPLSLVIKQVPFDIIFGIEVDSTAGEKTGAKFSIEEIIDWYSMPFKDPKIRSEVIQKGKLYSIEVPSDDFPTNGIRLAIKPLKNWVLKSYVELFGQAFFNEELYPVAILNAELQIFRGERCLTGVLTFNEAKELIKQTNAGITKIIIRLDENGELIQDCIIDGVVIYENREKKIDLSRGKT